MQVPYLFENDSNLVSLILKSVSAAVTKRPS